MAIFLRIPSFETLFTLCLHSVYTLFTILDSIPGNVFKPIVAFLQSLFIRLLNLTRSSVTALRIKTTPWMRNKHCELNYYVTQFLNGHECFRKYLHRFGHDTWSRRGLVGKCVGLLFEPQARHQNKIRKVFLRRFPLNRFLAKTLYLLALKKFFKKSVVQSRL